MGEFKQKIKITIIDISCKFHLQKNNVIYTYCIKLVEAIIRHKKSESKVAFNMQRIVYCNSFMPCKNQRELLTPGVIFTVNTYECFMENKNMIRTFCECKSSKTTLSLIKILLVFIKNRGGSRWTTRYTEYQKVKWQINFGQNYRINIEVKFKNTRFIQKRSIQQ